MECVVICLDNSEHSRNGDFSPSRFHQQTVATHICVETVLSKSNESKCGLVKMSGGPEALVSLTSEHAPLMQALEECKISPGPSLFRALNIAIMVLKSSKDFRSIARKIIAFVGHPVEDSVESLERVGAQCKKLNYGLVLINFGESDLNKSKLEKLILAANNNNNSSMVVPRTKNLEATIIPILGLGGELPKLDANDDELEWAIRESTQMYDNAQNELNIDADMDEELQRALELSQLENNPVGKASAGMVKEEDDDGGDRVDATRQAFEDPDFLAQLQEELGDDIPPETLEQIRLDLNQRKDEKKKDDKGKDDKTKDDKDGGNA